ncbi:MAG: tungsten formylmethanofuran dehydrogenase [Pseudomonadota bacterium]|nr:tungsten formylmethanofuran dehydrogenase [Pseudomonadota bacterium]
MPDGSGTSAWIDGAPASFDAAVIEAARLLGASAAPLFAHIGADVAGAREAALLAEQTGAALDHADSQALFTNLDPVRESGAMLTTPLEAARADLLLLIGDGVFDVWPDLAPRLVDRLAQGARTVWLCDSAGARAGIESIAISAGVARLSALARLRAEAKLRPLAATPDALRALAKRLREAKFGVAVWSGADLEPLAVEAIHGLVRDLNETTRFSTLPLAAPDALGVEQVCGWMTGFPLRTGFACGRPEHDPWRYDARRMIAAGEADCVVRVSAFASEAHIAIGWDEAPASVRFAVGRPGVDHDAILYDPRVGTFVAHPAATPAGRSVAQILAAIRARLGGPPC